MTNTITAETEGLESATVASLRDPEHSTVDLDSYKGRPTLAFNKNKAYPFSFGLLKIKIMVKHMKAMIRFAESEGKSID